VLGTNGSLEAFMKYDTNLDGSLTEAEFSKRLNARFEKLDTDGSGGLDRGELLFRVIRQDGGARRGGGRGPR